MATKTSYATFLLYSLFTSGVLGPEAANTRALVFNVKGEDLLFLDHPNRALDPAQRDRYRHLGLVPDAFRSVSVCAPPRRGDRVATPDVTSRAEGVTSFFWTLEEFCAQELLPFLFADAEDDRQQYTIVVHNVTQRLREARPAGDGAVSLDGFTARSFRELVDAGVRPGAGRRRRPLDRAGRWARARSTPSSAASTPPSATSSTWSGRTSPIPSGTGWPSTGPR